jgi:hypothetical protein
LLCLFSDIINVSLKETRFSSSSNILWIEKWERGRRMKSDSVQVKPSTDKVIL